MTSTHRCWILCPVWLGLAGLCLLLLVIYPSSASLTDTLTVTNTDDSGPGSLRQAIADAQPGDMVGFALSYPATITLTSGELAITKPLTISGPGPELLAVSGNGSSRVFRVDAPGGAEQIAVTLLGLTIRDGMSWSGGGVWNDEELTLTNVAFVANAVTGTSALGGGMYNQDSSPILTKVVFRGNTAEDDGGGMYNRDSSPVLSAVAFVENSAGGGGGIYNDSSNPALTNVVFRSNSALSGGGMSNLDSSPALVNVILSGNAATYSGGGLRNDGSSSPTLIQVTVSGNAADSGGGMYNGYPALATIQNSILSGNRAVSRGHQIYNTYSGRVPGVAHSILEGSGGSGAGWNATLGTDLGGNLDADPRFVKPVEPAEAPTMAGDLRPRAGPAMDAGDNGFLPPGVAVDLAGEPRIVNGVVDIGAYEVQPGLHLYKTATDLASADSWAMPGQALTFTLSLFNTFATTAMTGGVLSDTLPVGLELAGLVQLDPPGAGVAGAPPLVATDLEIDPGERVTVSLPVMVGTGVVPGTILANTASVTSTQVPTPQLSSQAFTVCAPRVTVTSDADAGLGSLRWAIASACPAGAVDFALATYPATITLTSGELTISRSLTVTGPGPDILAVSGNGASRVLRVDKPAESGSISVTINGLTIRDGLADEGGGLWSDENVTLIGVSLYGNRATGAASGYSGGGGVLNRGSLTLVDVVLGNNSAPNGGGLLGDGELANVVFDGNRASGYGGGMYGSGRLLNVVFDDNWAQWGGGMYINYRSPTLTNVTFRRNRSSASGGGLYSDNYSSPTLTNVIFQGNQASFGGGMVNYYGGSPTLTNVLFSGNAADEGGGMGNRRSHATLTNVTFGGNAADEGGGIHNRDCTLEIRNSILWDNGATQGDQIYNQDSTPAIAFSDIEGSGGSGVGWDLRLGYDGGGNQDADPQFAGPVDPAAAPTIAGNLRPIRNSPVIDAGVNAYLPHGVDTDLVGRPRIANGRVDMGAFEFQPGLSLRKTVDEDWVTPGEAITYVLVVDNDSTDMAMTGGVVSDTLPMELELAGPIELDPPEAGLVGAPPLLVTDLTVDPGQAVTIRLPVTVGVGVAPGAILVNRAAVTSTQVPTPQLAVHVLSVCADHLTVTSEADGGPGSLREAIANACPWGTIGFALPTYPATITLSTGELLIAKPLTLTGPGPDLLAVSGNGASRVFRVDGLGGLAPISATLSGLTIRDGKADEGAGLWNDEGLTLVDVAFRDNSADYPGGGGLYTMDSSPRLINVLFSGNSGSGGGGLYNQGGSPALTHVTFRGNSASSSGGGMCSTGGSPRLTHTTFRGNQATYGGGMYNGGSNPTLANVVLSGNWASNGGGMHNRSSNPMLSNVSFNGNSAWDGDGMYNWNSDPVIRNSILWDGSGQIYNDGGSSPTFAHCDVEASGGSGTGWKTSLGIDLGGNIDADPLFVDPVDPADAPTTAGDLRLTLGSPAINAGANDLILPGVTTDLDGNPRVVLGRVDLGAYEFQPAMLFYVYLPVVARSSP